MNQITRIGMDTSKSVFQLHCVDSAERVVLRRKLRRRDLLKWFGALAPTRVGIEACGGSNYWAREITALGHDVVLLPPQYVKAYVKRGKNDMADAEAICEAMSRPTMRPVPVKSAEQQSAQMLLTTREGLIRRRTQLSNAIRGNAAEFGLIAAKGLAKIEPLLARIAADESVPALARSLFKMYGVQIAEVSKLIKEIDDMLMEWHRTNALSRRLREIPSLGPIGASALAIKVSDAKAFSSGRGLAASLGLTPKDHSSGGKVRLGGITRAGDRKLRSTLVVGAMAHIQQVCRGRTKPSPWLARLLTRTKSKKLAAVALANRTVRIAWKLMVSGERYRSDLDLGATA